MTLLKQEEVNLFDWTCLCTNLSGGVKDQGHL